MTSIRLLHVSDVHFRADKKTDTEIVLGALLKDLEQLTEDKRCDAILFTGDLVFSGCSEADFDEAYSLILEPLRQAANVSPSQLFVCPGNHDICREKVRAFSALQHGLTAQLTSTEKANAFLDRLTSGDSEASLGIERMTPFMTFLARRLPHMARSHPLAAIGGFNVEGRSIGIASLNSTWRATGEPDDVDFSRLIVGERQVDFAIKELRDCDLSVALLHHPLEWLTPFDRASVEPLLLGSFDLLCLGHLHEASPKSLATTSGSCIISQSGSLYAGRQWYNGYQVVDVDLLSGQFTFRLREYDDRNRRFVSAEGIAEDGIFKTESPRSVSQDARSQVELFLRQYRHLLRERAKEHMDFVKFSDEYTDRVLDTFVAPPLWEREVPDALSEDSSGSSKNEIGVADVISESSNIAIIGDRKSGRTSLAYHIALEISAGRTARPAIPVSVDIRTYKFNFYDLRRSVLSFYGPAPHGFALEKSF